MRNHLFLLFAVSLVLCGMCLAQSTPVPALTMSNGNDLAVTSLGFVKDSRFDLGYGADIASSHFITQRFGIRGEADVSKLGEFSIREYGFRAGPVYRFSLGSRVQPYAQVLMGYAKVKASYTIPNRHYDGLSVLAGAGWDLHLSGPLYGRVGLDYVRNQGGPTQFVRGTAGLAFRYGGYR